MSLAKSYGDAMSQAEAYCACILIFGRLSYDCGLSWAATDPSFPALMEAWADMHLQLLPAGLRRLCEVSIAGQSNHLYFSCYVMTQLTAVYLDVTPETQAVPSTIQRLSETLIVQRLCDMGHDVHLPGVVTARAAQSAPRTWEQPMSSLNSKAIISFSNRQRFLPAQALPLQHLNPCRIVFLAQEMLQAAKKHRQLDMAAHSLGAIVNSWQFLDAEQRHMGCQVMLEHSREVLQLFATCMLKAEAVASVPAEAAVVASDMRPTTSGRRALAPGLSSHGWAGPSAGRFSNTDLSTAAVAATTADVAAAATADVAAAATADVAAAAAAAVEGLVDADVKSLLTACYKALGESMCSSLHTGREGIVAYLDAMLPYLEVVLGFLLRKWAAAAANNVQAGSAAQKYDHQQPISLTVLVSGLVLQAGDVLLQPQHVTPERQQAVTRGVVALAQVIRYITLAQLPLRRINSGCNAVLDYLGRALGLCPRGPHPCTLLDVEDARPGTEAEPSRTWQPSPPLLQQLVLLHLMPPCLALSRSATLMALEAEVLQLQADGMLSSAQHEEDETVAANTAASLCLGLHLTAGLGMDGESSAFGGSSSSSSSSRDGSSRDGSNMHDQQQPAVSHRPSFTWHALALQSGLLGCLAAAAQALSARWLPRGQVLDDLTIMFHSMQMLTDLSQAVLAGRVGVEPAQTVGGSGSAGQQQQGGQPPPSQHVEVWAWQQRPNASQAAPPNALPLVLPSLCLLLCPPCAMLRGAVMAAARAQLEEGSEAARAARGSMESLIELLCTGRLVLHCSVLARAVGRLVLRAQGAGHSQEGQGEMAVRDGGAAGAAAARAAAASSCSTTLAGGGGGGGGGAPAGSDTAAGSSAGRRQQQPPSPAASSQAMKALICRVKGLEEAMEEAMKEGLEGPGTMDVSCLARDGHTLLAACQELLDKAAGWVAGQQQGLQEDGGSNSGPEMTHPPCSLAAALQAAAEATSAIAALDPQHHPHVLAARLGLPPVGCSNPGCANLAVMGVQDHKYQVCSKCRRVRYCSKECQLQDWKAQHKRLCPVLQQF